jgi:hypothetical protein
VFHDAECRKESDQYGAYRVGYQHNPAWAYLIAEYSTKQDGSQTRQAVPRQNDAWFLRGAAHRQYQPGQREGVNSTFSVGMCLGLITLFRRVFNRQGKLGRFLSRQAYTVYIIHVPIIVGLALAARGIHLETLLKFALVALFGVPLCFELAFLVRKIPLASRIL